VVGCWFTALETENITFQRLVELLVIQLLDKEAGAAASTP